MSFFSFHTNAFPQFTYSFSKVTTFEIDMHFCTVRFLQKKRMKKKSIKINKYLSPSHGSSKVVKFSSSSLLVSSFCLDVPLL